MTERIRGISGNMFAGKTDELLRRVTRAEIAGKDVLVFKPAIDDRWGRKDKIRSHAGAEHAAIPVATSEEILNYLTKNTEIVAIDEIQFMDENIVPVVDEIVERDIEVNFDGLPLDFRGEPFGQMPVLLAKSDDIERLTAICTYHCEEDGKICGKEATRTQRFVNGMPANYNDEIILIGAQESYAPRCPTHHKVPGKPRKMLK
ncbi:MAG TPA: thymidine kinase [Patescibacteria group bacterium]|nr:thymidine kinase [Patescibacteria group bacterium]